MKSVLRALALGVVLLLTSLLHAQTESVSLVVIAEVNTTLDANCQSTVLPQEMLKGDFDVDGNGILPYEAFSVVVQDDNPDNGEVIDNCGTFRVLITASGIAGFTTAWGEITAEDITPPEFTATPSAPAGPLYCVDLPRIALTDLPNTVSRCYRVNTTSGTVVAGSLDPLLEERLLAGGGLPAVTDNCSEIVEVCVNDIVTRDPENPECRDVRLTRTFTATDGSCAGKTNDPAVTSYEILFVRPLLDNIDRSEVPETVVIECAELAELGLAFGEAPAPREEDFPFFAGPGDTRYYLGLGETGTFCNVGVSYEDSPEILACEKAYKVVRTFTLIDWCFPTDIRTYTQVLKLGDFSPPTFTAPTQDLNFDGQPDAWPLRFTTNAGNECGAYIRLDLPGIALQDDCSDVLSLRADIFPDRDTDGAPIGTFSLNIDDLTAEISSLIPVGTHTLRYTYRDECGNESFTDVDFIIADGIEPIAVCEDGLNVSLTSGLDLDGQNRRGIAVITPEMVDKGSFDDCTSVTLAIGRVRQLADGTYELLDGATYGDAIEFTCEDLGDQLVGLRVTDEFENVNYCWLTVAVEDKIAPSCTPPPSLELGCVAFRATNLPANITEATDDMLNLAFGRAFGNDNCEVSLSQEIEGGINNCGIGSFTRTFTVEDGEGFTNLVPCIQTIDVEGIHDYTLALPADNEAFCREAPTYGDVEVIAAACDLFTKDFRIDTLTSDADECYKLRIEHRIINWCEYDGIGEAYLIPRDFDGDNDFRERTFIQVYPSPLSGRDTAFLDTDATRGNAGYTLRIDDGDDTDGTNDGNGDDVSDRDAYAEDNSRGHFLYYQYFKVYDEVAPEIVANDPTECFAALDANCTGEVTIVFELTDECTDHDQVTSRIGLDVDYVEANGFERTRFLTSAEFSDNGQGDYTVVLRNVPTGNHAIRVQGADGCGNVDVEIIPFCVTDQKAPTPICTNQLTVTLMPNGDGTGMAAIWAADYIASPVTDCSGDVVYSIYTEEEAQEADFVPATGREGLLLDCNSDATVPVRVYAIDPVGQADFCSVFVLVQRAANACVADGTATLRGTITTEKGVAIADVAVSISATDELDRSISDVDGKYDFDNLTLGDDYTVDAYRDDYVNHSQGVSTFDLVLITRFILGLQSFEGPFERLAADANNDEVISVQDIIAIRRLILGLDREYQSNAAYRFVDAKFNFPVAADPWATTFPEVVNVNNLPGNVFDADFIGVMVGNVNGNAFNALQDGEGRPRSGARRFGVEDRQLRRGLTYRIPILAAGNAGLTGVQGTFTFGPGVTVTAVETAGTQFATDHLNAELLTRGQIGFSYNSDLGLTAAAPVLFVELVAREDVALSEVFALTDELVFTEGYLPDGQAVNLGLEFTRGAVTTGNRLGQNEPNPVTLTTTIPYVLAVAGPVTLEVRDLNGRLLLRQRRQAPAGAGRFTLNRAELGAAGIVTYTLAAETFTATRKMIVR